MKCPVCKDVALVISERKGIEIDYCPDCRGIWLDRGELDKIIAKSAEEIRPSQSQDYQRSHRDDDYKKPYRKKSFLEEIFD